jgi:hypothetical protein
MQQFTNWVTKVDLIFLDTCAVIRERIFILFFTPSYLKSLAKLCNYRTIRLAKFDKDEVFNVSNPLIFQQTRNLHTHKQYLGLRQIHRT